MIYLFIGETRVLKTLSITVLGTICDLQSNQCFFFFLIGCPVFGTCYSCNSLLVNFPFNVYEIFFSLITFFFLSPFATKTVSIIEGEVYFLEAAKMMGPIF